jgi:putative component of toxin-antitoxin plasmid stabilization module
MEIREYETPEGRSPFGERFDDLDHTAAAKVTVALARLEHGNTSSVKAVGSGVSELKIDFVPATACISAGTAKAL